jgi:hypothetical protein
MKKYFLILTFAIFTNTYAQYNNSLSVSGGIVEEGSYGGLVNYNYNVNSSNYEFGVLHSMFNLTPKENIKASFTTTTFQVGYLRNLIRNRTNSILINFGLGAFAGTETIKKSNDYIVKDDGGIIAGVYGAAQLDFYTTDNFAFLLRGQQNYNIKSTTGKMNPYIGFGLKFNF